MNALLTVSVTDSYRRFMEEKLDRIAELNSQILMLEKEKKMIAIDLDHSCDLLNAVIEDPDYKENIVESVIDSHKLFIKRCRQVANSNMPSD